VAQGIEPGMDHANSNLRRSRQAGEPADTQSARNLGTIFEEGKTTAPASAMWDPSCFNGRIRMIRTVHIFRCGSADLYGVTEDQTGGNLPTTECSAGWRRVRSMDWKKACRLGAWAWPGRSGTRRCGAPSRTTVISSAKLGHCLLSSDKGDSRDPSGPRRRRVAAAPPGPLRRAVLFCVFLRKPSQKK
jgi:hypothetical protein